MIERHVIKANIILTIEKNEFDLTNFVDLESKLNEMNIIDLEDGSRVHLRFHFTKFKLNKEI